MVGAMTSKTVLFTTILDFTMKGKSVMDVQSSLDSIFIGIVPLLLTFGCFKLLKKKVNIIVFDLWNCCIGNYIIRSRNLLRQEEKL